MVLSRDTLRLPTLPKETVHCAALGGEVVVRGMQLSERLAVSGQRADLAKPRQGESQADAEARAGATLVPRVLAFTVLLDDGSPALDVAEWEALGATEPGACMALFDVAMRLSGHDQQANAKN